MLLVNPLHAVRPGAPQEPSPYFPSSRLFRNPLYLRIQDLPGARDDPDVARAPARGGAAPRCADHRPRPGGAAQVARARGALGALPRRRRLSTPTSPARGCCSSGTRASASSPSVTPDRGLGGPLGIDVPDGRAVAELMTTDRSRVDFHRWVQWLLDTQLDRAGRELPLVHDLAVGFAPDGADAWMWQDVVASEARIGAPVRRLQSGRPGLGRPAVRPGSSARDRLRAAGRNHAPDDERGRRGAHRPRHGSLPPVVGAAQRHRSLGGCLRPLPGERAARHPRSRERARRLRRGGRGPRHRRIRRARRVAPARPALVPARLVRSRGLRSATRPKRSRR